MTGSTLNVLALALQAQPAPGNRGLIIMVVYIISFGLIAWFLLIRPQRRMQQQHQELIANLKRNDEVMTDGGLIGTVVHIADERITIKTGDTRVVVARGKIQRILGAEAQS